jgi:diaminopimelate decarboxylase
VPTPTLRSRRLPEPFAANERGHLTIGGCDATELAATFGTPLYVFDEAHVREQARRYRRALAAHYPKSAVFYAGKAFLCGAMAALAEEEGMGLDVVSGGELYTALGVGFPAADILLHGNNKSAGELAMALDAGVGRIVVDNFDELAALEAMAAARGMRPRVLLRVTPGIEAHTHEYVETGLVDSKFGFPLEGGQALRAAIAVGRSEWLSLAGLHCHIGSQMFLTRPVEAAVEVMMAFAAEVASGVRAGGLRDAELNIGGGLGVRYVEGDTPPSIEDFVRDAALAVRAAARRHGLPEPMLQMEPGRSIVNNAGATLYTVGAVKEIPGVRTYVAVDGGMGDNPRPALYGASYDAVIAGRAGDAPSRVVAVAGKCCESGDMLIREVGLADPRPGDLLAVLGTGAYNYSMAGNYNRLPRPAVIFAAEGQARVVVRRETYDDLVRLDVLPEPRAVVINAAARRVAAACLDTRQRIG